MQLLLTNDDGIDADGLAALAEGVAPFGELVVFAPMAALSGCSHRVTTDHPIRIEQRGENRFAVDGTPADCVRVALHRYGRFDWVVSGINHGGNLGADVHYSGTVAAVRESGLHGVPGIAFSQYVRRNLDYDWPRCSSWVSRVFGDLSTRSQQPGTFWNVNFPHLEPSPQLPDAIDCPLETGPLPLSYRLERELYRYDGDYHQRATTPGSDVAVCFSGRIAITQIPLFGRI